MALGLGGLDQQLNDKVATFGSMPESELAKKVKLSSGLLDALAAEKVLQQKAAAARELSLSQESSPKTIIQKNEEEVLRNTQQELANQVDGTLKNKQAKRTKNMNRMAGMDPRMLQAMQKKRGLAAAPVQRRQVAAQGGIVGYAPGGPVSFQQDPYGTNRGKAIDSIRNRTDLTVEEKKELLRKIMLNPQGDSTTIPVGTVSSARPKGLMGVIPAGMETSAMDVASDARLPFKALELEGDKSEYLPYLAGLLGPKKSGNLLTEAEQSVVDAARVPVTTPDFKPITTPIPEEKGITTVIPEEKKKEKVTPTPTSTPTITSKPENKERDLSRLLYMMSAKGGLGSRARAGREFDLQEFEKKIQQDTIDAKRELNKITKDSTNYQMLQNRLTQVNTEIQSIMERLATSPIGIALARAQQEASDDPEDTRKQQVLAEQKKLYNLELERLADPTGADVGLLVQQKELQEVVRSYTKNMKTFDGFGKLKIR